MPANTTAPKTITPTALFKALDNAAENVAKQLSDTQYAEIVRLVEKLIANSIKEELKL